MFEKEAIRSFDELDDRGVGDDWSIEESYINGFSIGAEFGYNKSKEEIEKLRELVSDCLFYCDHIDPYYNECLTEDNIFERAKKLGIDEE